MQTKYSQQTHLTNPNIFISAEDCLHKEFKQVNFKNVTFEIKLGGNIPTVRGTVFLTSQKT